MLIEFICHFRGVKFNLHFYSISDGNNVGPDQTPHVTSGLGLHCLLMVPLPVSM